MKQLISLASAFMVIGILSGHVFASEHVNLWFPPAWKSKNSQAKSIAATLAEQSGLSISPRIAKGYPDILKAFSSDVPSLAYAGSFIQTVIHERGLGSVLLQSLNGRDFYSGVMIYPKDEDPDALLKNFPGLVAFTIGASSGESSAKAATGGKASLGVPSHLAGANAVKYGRAKAAFVKNWWWDANKNRFPQLAMKAIPGISAIKNPDNLLTASKAVSPDAVSKILHAAAKEETLFRGSGIGPFDSNILTFSINLMKKGQIDPLTYKW